MGNRCKTKYPILLVHGLNSRDFRPFAYWGRIGSTLEQNGAKVYYGHQDAGGTIEANALILRKSLRQILRKEQCGKVNIIAHSKGGLEARYLIHELEMADYVASLTTISTPHRGLKIVDSLYLHPGRMRLVSFFGNLYCKIIGDKEPDFYTALHQLSTDCCKRFNRDQKDSPEVYYRSYATTMKDLSCDLFLVISNFLIQKADGENDGLVPVESAKWTGFRGIAGMETKHGISHEDIVDFRKKDRGDFDVRKFYVELTEELKEKGL